MLAKSGYFSSDPRIIYDAPVNIVLDTYNYEIFSREYEQTYVELNKG